MPQRLPIFGFGLARGIDDGHPAHGLHGEPEALTGRQARRADDLELDELGVEVADAVDGVAPESGVSSELAPVELADTCDGENVPTAATPAGVVVLCELSEGIPAIPAPRAGATALVLVRLFTEPIGMLELSLPAAGLTPVELAREIVAELWTELRPRLEQAGVPLHRALPTDGLCARTAPAFPAGREAALRDGPEIAVAVCTRDRTDDLARLLHSLRDQVYTRFSVTVVDNAPSDDRTRALVASFRCEYPLQYVVEPRPGLSWARNRAIDASTAEVIAWADDDEVCDPFWTAEIARAFVEVPEAGAVTGLVAPAELQTETQAWFERYSGIRRGRGFDRAVFSPATFSRQSPLYPLPPYGAGANMAFRRQALDRIGRFDTALGTGTATLAGEDTAALSSLLYGGGTVVYQPSAITHHRHRRDYAALERVMVGYGRGLSAYYASMVARHPRCLPELVRLSRRALRDQLSRNGSKLSDLQGMPAGLLALNRKGLLQGALLYPGARLRARRLASAAPALGTS